MTNRRALRPGEWGEVDIRPRHDRHYPVGNIKPAEPVAPHAPWGRAVCDSWCFRNTGGCGARIGIVSGAAEGEVHRLDVTASQDGAFVLETSGHRQPMAVRYDAAFHAGWPRFAAHVCAPEVQP